jgi:alpha-galactosidase
LISACQEKITMTKIALIGAGSVEFTRELCNDFMLTPSMQESTISLMDIDPKKLQLAKQAVQAIVDQRGLEAQVEATLDLRESVKNANYVIAIFQQGGMAAYALDIEIPRKYGVEQCIGDTLGPGGIFRALRTFPVMLELCRTMDEVAPDALLLNYVNPMAANCMAVDRASRRPFVGLCHSVQGTSEMLARWINVPYDEIHFLCAGINHQAFFLEFRRGSQDLYPLIREAVEQPEIAGKEPVRIDLLKHFGYFVTESSGHASEYVPYFRKSPEMVEKELVPRFTSDENEWFDYGRTGGYFQKHRIYQESARDEFEAIAKGEMELPSGRSREYCSHIIEAIETHRPIRINGNVPNHSLIDNLPYGCCVEVPCLVDSNGIQPTHIKRYPPQLAGLNRTNINVQELMVEAAVTGNVEAVYHAAMLDPLTASACTLPQIHQMVTEMLEKQTQWLPQFKE